MAHFHVSTRALSVRSVLGIVFVASLIPLRTASAQSAPFVKVTNDETEIKSNLRGRSDVVMTAPAGTVLEVIDTEGDRYRARKDNWYFVLLPRDAWGTQRFGWISGRDVEHAPAPEPPKPCPEASAQSKSGGVVVEEAPKPAPTTTPTAPVAPSTAEAAGASSDQPEFHDLVVLHFQFDKSNLTDDAKARLASALATLKAGAQGVAFALEGHADATGSERYNEKLALARAETVKRYLAEQYVVPIGKISIVSFGETQPAASNATREGRAQNRRVVVKVDQRGSPNQR